MNKQFLFAASLAGGMLVGGAPTVKADELSELKAAMESMRAEMTALKAQVAAQAVQAAQGTQAAAAVAGSANILPAAPSPASPPPTTSPPASPPLTIAGIPLVATPHTHLFLGGNIDGGYRADSGTKQGTVQSVNSGQSRADRLTFEGYQELPYGLRAVAAMEAGFSLDTGAGANNPPNVPAGAFSFGRYSAVGLGRDDWGYITFGRQYTPLWATSASGGNDPFDGNYLGGVGTIYNTTIRASNAAVYSYGYSWETMLNPAPKKGLGIAAMYSAGEAAAPSPNDSGAQFGGAISYGGGDGKWWVGYAYHQVSGSNNTMSATAPVASTPTLKQQTLGASYDLGFASLHAGINAGSNDNKNAKTGGVDSQSWDVGAVVPIASAQKVRFLYGAKFDQTTAKANLSTVQLSYEYRLQLPQLGMANYNPYVNLYAAIGIIDNNSNSAATLVGTSGTILPGATARSFITGMLFVF
jgi:predicted porin/outer membrane murein-binding lipoprotein Lpp